MASLAQKWISEYSDEDTFSKQDMEAAFWAGYLLKMKEKGKKTPKVEVKSIPTDTAEIKLEIKEEQKSEPAEQPTKVQDLGDVQAVKDAQPTATAEQPEPEPMPEAKAEDKGELQI